MKKMIACCGLDCKQCDAYLATINNDDDLREKTAELWSEMNNVPITPEMINCMGCCSDGIKTPYCNSLCEIRKCVMKNSFENCGSCNNLNSCKIVGIIVNNNKDAMENLNNSKI